MKDPRIHDLESLPADARGGVLTIGSFDGVHMGHQRILVNCRMLASRCRCRCAVLTFDPLPEFVLHPASAPPLLAPMEENLRLLLSAGADYVVVMKATPQLLEMSAGQFVREVVVGRFAPKHMVEGQDFFFGRGRMGNVDTLAEAGGTHGFDVQVVEPVTLVFPEGERRVSSTLIRQFVTSGRIDDANYCLGRKFSLYGTVVAGSGRGRLLEFPTVNLDVGPQVVPGDGVYAGKAQAQGRQYVAAISIGSKPTLHSAERRTAIEAFLIGAGGDFYGRPVVLSFHHRIRDQRRFHSTQELKTQIAADVEQVVKIMK